MPSLRTTCGIAKTLIGTSKRKPKRTGQLGRLPGGISLNLTFQAVATRLTINLPLHAVFTFVGPQSDDAAVQNASAGRPSR
jgi:hypothetical protein